MPQRFYIDESDLDGQLKKLDENLWGMLDFAYLHEDMTITIESLMGEWFKEAFPDRYELLTEEYNNLEESEKEFYDDIDEWLMDVGRWWMEEFENLDNDNKKLFIERYRLTIASGLHSDTYNEETLMEQINDSWKYIIT